MYIKGQLLLDSNRLIGMSKNKQSNYRDIHPFHVMAKPIGPICNIDCKYCFYLEKENLYRNKSQGLSDWMMSDKVLESYISQKFEANSTGVETFAWQGGEPTLLGVDFFRKVIKYQEKYAKDLQFYNTLQTNGILLNDEWCEFFLENDFLVGLSIDGPRELHDKYRVDKGGKPTFDRVMKGIDYLSKHGVKFNTLTVVQKDNSYKPLEVYNFLKEVGSGFMQFIPIVERNTQKKLKNGLSLVLPDKTNAILSDWSVESEQFGNFLIRIFDEWIRNDVGKFYVQIFDIALESWYGKQPSLCIFAETCGRALAIEHNGDLYSCDHYVFPENKLGNIMDSHISKMEESKQQHDFGINKLDTLPAYCKECEVRFICNGECPKNRFLNTPDGDTGLNYLCAGYKKFFNYIDPYMQFMVNELQEQKPPSKVMSWAKDKDKENPSL